MQFWKLCDVRVYRMADKSAKMLCRVVKLPNIERRERLSLYSENI
jgi:hypothetical protein